MPTVKIKFSSEKLYHTTILAFPPLPACDMLDSMHPVSIYVHIPFCLQRCSYCDFNTYAGRGYQMPGYVDAVCQEAKMIAEMAEHQLLVHTIFFGGGTPSILPTGHIARIMEALHASFDLRSVMEVSLEANPGTVSLDSLREYRHLGFNRISFGMQSASPEDLSLLNRIHDSLQVIQAVDWAREADFQNINLDLIFGIPGQDLSSWQNTLEQALSLQPEHLSLYSLTIENGTILNHRINAGIIPPPDDDLAADMYEWASLRLEQAGYHHYEISNWAKTDADKGLMVCLHNMQYWRNLPYIGLGAGAHAFIAGYRLANISSIEGYIQAIQADIQIGLSFPISPATESKTLITAKDEMQETMMVGLRLLEEGVWLAGFQQRFGVSIQQVFGREINALENQGLLDVSDRVRLTPRGILLGNVVFREFVGD
jgi:oxygen-independent coproporphyrinogen-3 oxidase